MTVRAAAAGALVGAALAVCCLFSPLAVAVVAAATLILPPFVRGLPPRDREWLTWIVAVALVARVAAIAVAFAANVPRHDDQFLGAAGGDEAYTMARALRTRNIILGQPASKYDYFVAYDEYGRNAYVTAATVLQTIFGPTPYSMRLLNALVFTAAALLLFRLSYGAYGRVAAFGGLAAVLFWPTLFAWSISLLKEPLYFLCGAVVIVSVIRFARGTSWRGRAASAAAAFAAAFLCRDFRPGAAVLMAGGIALGLVAWWAAQSRRTLAISALASVALAAALAVPAIGTRVVAGLDAAAKVQTGHVFTVGHAYKLLDAGFYMNPRTPASSTLTLTPAEAARYAIRAAASFVLVPLPWQLQSTRELAYLPEQIGWYVVAALAVAGLVAGMRRDRLVTSVLIGFTVPTAVVLSLTNGNVGTLLRLRGLVTPYLMWVSAAGLSAIAAAVERRGRSRLVDERGRLFGRINLFDAALLAGAVILIPVAYGTYLLFRTPPVRVASVTNVPITREERRIAGGVPMSAKLKVRGSGLRPMLRASIDSTPALGFVFEDPNAADVLAPAMADGTYDLVLFDGVQEVARAPKAVVIGSSKPDRMATVRVRITAPDEVLDLIHTGDTDVAGGAGAASVLAVGRRSAAAAGRSVVDVTIRLGLDRDDAGWRYRDVPVKAGTSFALTTDRYRIDGIVIEVGS